MRVAAFVLTAIALWPVRVVLTAPQQDQVRPTFKSAVDMVAITAVVRDEDGHPVNNLKLDDFTLTDNGHARPISTVQSSESAIDRLLTASRYSCALCCSVNCRASDGELSTGNWILNYKPVMFIFRS